jgi:acyl-CoA thioesterase-1
VALVLLIQPIAGCSKKMPSETALPNAAQAVAPTGGLTLAADDKLVVAFGDSLYAGYNLPQDKGLAPILNMALAGRHIKAVVVNAGVSGDTTAAGLQRLAFTLDGLPRKPDLLLLGLGGNDMLRGLSPAETRSNLDQMLTELQRRQIPVMLTGMLAAPNLGPDYSAAFNPIYPALAKKFDVPLYPFLLKGVAGNRTLQLPDGIHPNDKGVEIIVGNIEPMVEKALSDPS